MTDRETADKVAQLLTTQSHSDSYYVDELIEQAERLWPGWKFVRITVDAAHWGDVVAQPTCSCLPDAHLAWPQAGGEIPPPDLDKVKGWLCPIHGAMWALIPGHEHPGHPDSQPGHMDVPWHEGDRTIGRSSGREASDGPYPEHAHTGSPWERHTHGAGGKQ